MAVDCKPTIETPLRTISIRQKLLLITMTSSAVALLLIASSFLIYENLIFRQTIVQDLTTQARVIGERSTAALSFNDANAAAEYLGSLADKAHIVVACFYSGTNRFAPPYFRDKQSPRTAPLHPGPEGWSFSRNALSGFQPIRLSGQTIGWIYLESDLDELHARLRNYAYNLCIFGLISLLAAYLLATRLQKIISGPIANLAETARAVTAQKNYSVRARKESEDELGQLIDGFNGMLAQIQERDGALRRVNDELENRVAERTRDLQQHLDHISLLNQITYAVAECRDSAEIIPIVLQQLDDHLPLDYSVAYRFDKPAGMWTFMGRSLKSRSIAEQIQAPVSIPVANTMFSRCSKGEIVYVPDQSAFDPVPGQADLPVLRNVAGAGLLSAVGAPLIVEGKVFGVLVFRRRARDGFSEVERDFIKGLSAHVSQAIYQAQLYQNLQKAYDELRQTQQAAMQQERLKALGQMASGIAHDINNALSPITGYAELIRMEEPGLREDSRQFLQYIMTASKDIAHIVARLREFYRPRAARESLLALNLNHVVKQVVDMTRPRWRDIPQSRGIMIEMRADLDPHPPKFAGIESEIREALVNLVLNAVDALPAGGVITVRTRAIIPEGEKPDAAPTHAILEVSDTGVGMDEETGKHCLEPFFTTKGKRGTGLGLAMVYGVVERHEGKIEIDSKPGKGTTLRLIFPIRQLTAKTPGSGKHHLPGPFRILFIDDEPALRQLMQKILARDGHHVETPDGGRAGVEALRAALNREEPFDVVITDLGMPYMDGHEVAAAVKHESPGTPVVMLTGWGVFMKDDGALPAHVDGILSKPPHVDELRNMLRHVTGKAAAPR
jgi:signal transduction histidine kinase/ActR/RegA family two-component response regulator/HAMP domain-containing protein